MICKIFMMLIYVSKFEDRIFVEENGFQFQIISRSINSKFICPSAHQEELRKAILASMQEVDIANPWIKDASGRHTNVMAVLDWPDSDDSDTETYYTTQQGILPWTQKNFWLPYVGDGRSRLAR